jgi:hypothetical protein
MVAVDMFDYSDMMAQDKVGLMVLDTCNTVGSRVHCQLMKCCTLLLLDTQTPINKTNILHDKLSSGYFPGI